MKDVQNFTKWGLILSVLGIAVGTGNIWRFPRIAALNGTEDGAGAFLFAWAIGLFVWSIPLIIAEYAIGRNGRKGTIGSTIELIGDKFAWLGGFVGFVAMAIMFYYSVVAGWCLYYLIQSATTALPQDTDTAMMVWDSFQGSYWPVVLHATAIGFGGFVILNGVKMIQRVNMILVPTLLIILLISLVRALMLPGSFEGVQYLFTPDWASLAQPTIWLEALTQNAWDTGAGWGLILSYAAYMKLRDNVTVRAFQTGIGNNLVSLTAAIIIFSTVFAILGASMSRTEIIEVMQTSGPASTGLTFIWMPQLFVEMAGGRVFAILFFLALSFAALSSLIAMIELAVRLFIDTGITRRMATYIVCTLGFLLGLPSAVNLTIFANQDFVWGVGLMISGSLIAFSVIKYNAFDFRENLINTEKEGLQSGYWWEFIIKYVIPVEAVLLLGWWIFQSAFSFAPDEWYNPFNPYSVATCFVQWGIVMSLFIIYNNKIAKATTGDRK